MWESEGGMSEWGGGVETLVGEDRGGDGERRNRKRKGDKRIPNPQTGLLVSMETTDSVMTTDVG